MVAASLSAAWGQTAKPKMAAITNVASYGNGPISPGEMVVIFGSGMGPSSVVGLQLDQQGRVANTLSQVQVLFDGNPAPLIYVSATQISAMVPYGLAGKSSTQIQRGRGRQDRIRGQDHGARSKNAQPLGRHGRFRSARRRHPRAEAPPAAEAQARDFPPADLRPLNSSHARLAQRAPELRRAPRAGLPIRSRVPGGRSTGRKNGPLACRAPLPRTVPCCPC